jgi:predicted methyltransferase
MPASIVLSCIQARPLLHARNTGQRTAQISLDLGLSTITVTLEPGHVLFPDGQWLAWESVEAIAAHEASCFAVEANAAHKIQRFSEQFQRHYSLMPTEGAPTLLIAGFPMHRIKGVDPHGDTQLKIRALAPVRGRVLDTCTGLGYTAIEAARTARHVVTVELDPITLDIARRNPWSRALFENPKIEQIVGDVCEVIETFADETFTCLIHDPPTFALAGELYAGAFYRQLFRVLRRGGRAFHYVGDLESKSGAGVARGVVRRLRESGFARVVRRPEAFGVVAYK